MAVTERAKHTPEPWGVDPYTARNVYLTTLNPDPDATPVATMSLVDYHRAALCVNACEGISNEALESGVVRELVEALEDLKTVVEDVLLPQVSGEGWLAEMIRAQSTFRQVDDVLAKVRGGDEA